MNNSNWFTEPYLRKSFLYSLLNALLTESFQANNLQWSQATLGQQYKNNQLSYPSVGWDTYPPGGYNPERDEKTSPPITDWIPGQEPGWAPIAGGVGFGIPSSNPPGPNAVNPFPGGLVGASPPPPPPPAPTTTTPSPTLPASTSAAAPPPPSSSTAVSGSGTVAHYGQCGGQGWTGPTVCDAGYTCQQQAGNICKIISSYIQVQYTKLQLFRLLAVHLRSPSR